MAWFEDKDTFIRHIDSNNKKNTDLKKRNTYLYKTTKKKKDTHQNNWKKYKPQFTCVGQGVP